MFYLKNSQGVVVFQSEHPPIYESDSKHWVSGLQMVYDPDYSLALSDDDSPATTLRHITKLAFRNRFTTQEKVLIDLASLDNPAASLAARQQAAAVRVSLADAAAATYIDLDRPDTRAGVVMLESAAILSPGRAMEILDAAILDSERAT